MQQTFALALWEVLERGAPFSFSHILSPLGLLVPAP